MNYVQTEVMKWQQPTPHPMMNASKVAEEAGEVCGATIKTMEGRFTAERIAEEAADVVIALYGLACSVGFDLDAAVKVRWDNDVKHRTFTTPSLSWGIDD